MFGHWKYTGPKDTIENAWAPPDPEKKLLRNVDQVDDHQKLKQLEDAIKICSKKLVDSNPNKPWMYTGPKDTIENMHHVDHLREWYKTKYEPQIKDSDEEDYPEDELDEEKKLAAEKKREANDNKKIHPAVPKFNVKEKSELYEKEYLQIKKYPWKIKYEDYMESSQEESEDLSLGKKKPAGGGGAKKKKPDVKKKGGRFSESDVDLGSDDDFNIGKPAKGKEKKDSKP